MALFRRKNRSDGADDVPSSPPVDPDPWLPVLSRADATVLDLLARQAFAARGVEVTSAGDGVLTAADGRTYGLANLAAAAGTQPRPTWIELVAGHVAGLLASHDLPEAESLDDVRSQVFPRLRRADDIPTLPGYAPTVLPGVVALVAIDYPDHVAELLNDEKVDELGGWPALLAVGLANLLVLPALEHQVIQADPERDDAAVHVLTGDDFFVPSRLLVLDEVLAGLGLGAAPHGVLVVVPNRHLMALHVLSGVGVVAAMQLLTRIGAGECDTQPGALSPHVYFRAPTGDVEQVTRVDDGALVVEVAGALATSFAALGLVG